MIASNFSTCWTMSTTFSKPTTKFPKIRFASDHLTSLEFQYARAKATEAYNTHEQRVPLLSFNGPEDLLQRFIDPTLPCDDTTSAGQALFGGTFKAYEFQFIFNKNFTDSFFIASSGTVTRAGFGNITVTPVSKYCLPLTFQEIIADQPLSNFLKEFEEKLFKPCDYIFNCIGPLSFTAGYTKNYQCFEHIDFVDVTFQGGLLVNEQNLNVEHSTEFPVFLPPLYPRHNLGVPLQANIEIGLYEWLNIGGTALVIPFISSDKKIRLNSTPTNNVLFAQEKTLTHLDQQPFIYFNGYFQAEELIPKVSFLLAVTFAKQFKTTFTPDDKEKYPVDIVNTYTFNQEWQRTCIHFEIEFDAARKDHHTNPRIKFIYIHPVHATSTYKSNAFAPEIGIDICYNF